MFPDNGLGSIDLQEFYKLVSLCFLFAFDEESLQSQIIMNRVHKAILVSVLLGLQFNLFGQSPVERIIHTDGNPPIIGEGIAGVTKSGANIEVTISDLGLLAQYLSAKIKLTGMQIGLLTPSQRAKRSGAQYDKRIPMTWEVAAASKGARFEPDSPLTATFPEEPGANLKDYHVCLKIFVSHNDSSETFVFAHTAEAFSHRDFFPLRKASDDVAAPPATPKVVITPPLQTKYDDLNAFVKRIRDGFDKAAQKFEVQQNAEIANLNQGYLKQLKQVQKFYMDRGNSTAALKVRAEINSVSGNTKDQPIEDYTTKGLERLQKSRKLYMDARKRIEGVNLTELRRLVKLGNGALKKQASALTRKGDLDRVEALSSVIPTWHGRPDMNMGSRQDVPTDAKRFPTGGYYVFVVDENGMSYLEAKRLAKKKKGEVFTPRSKKDVEAMWNIVGSTRCWLGFEYLQSSKQIIRDDGEGEAFDPKDISIEKVEVNPTNRGYEVFLCTNGFDSFKVARKEPVVKNAVMSVMIFFRDDNL
ncbi:MAG: hypothetical protein QM496_06975 [Verrucomicrobiota bacterium]